MPFSTVSDTTLTEHIPLEQGLRQYTLSLFTFFFSTHRTYSIRTRIKTERIQSLSTGCHLLIEHIPLEQGLRPLTSTTAHRAYSIRTRIKTNHYIPEMVLSKL